MQMPLQITLRDMGPSEAVDRYIRTRASKLERFSDRIIACHVTVDTPHRHKRHGHHYRVLIDLRVPGDEIVVKRDPTESKEQEDIHASIDAAFDDAQRRLEDYVRRQRGDVKRHESP